MFGLDISDRTLRLVSLVKRGKKIFIQSASEIKVPEGILKEGEVLKPEPLTSLIRDLIQLSGPHKIRSREVIACLPERKSFIKIIQVLETNNDSIKTELVNHVPFSLDEMYWDWQSTKKIIISEKTNVQVGAVPKKIVDTYQTVLKKANLIPWILEIESMAIARALLPLQEKNEDVAKLIIDLGLERTSFIIADKGLIPFTSGVITISGNELTNSISKALSLPFLDAEKAKILAGFSNKIGKGEIKKLLETPLKILIQAVEEIIEFYQTHYDAGNPIKTIILSGGGANLKEINGMLEQSLKLKVIKGDSLTNLEKKIPPLINGQNQSSFATAIGLALRGMYHDYS